MTPERLHRIRAVYEAAVDTPDAARHAVLERECNGDEELRLEVERLLGAREHLPEWLSGPVLGVTHAALASELSTSTQPGPAGRMHFAPGTVLAQRYRIIYLLGRGGMGEVYRADDLVLRQPVALKFLPEASEAALNRFRNEVRTARQISHPNVCRVYDIGEADGLTYLSMEYVDGEDLASLLRRIGKLPQDKALEIARQLCAGLAAAQDKGIIHRDLKPANIMLDGRGTVRITDFGIAGVAAQIRDMRSGTPDYMSPEQMAGKEVTPRSDIYALGIVLCELMTGQRPPLRPHDPGTTALDPAVERVIQRCLNPDPKLRPPSAMEVSASLPGGDLLAAALARGETPSPELVADAGPVEGLHPWIAVACLVAVILAVTLLSILRQKHDVINQIPMENAPEVLAARARDIATSFGYVDRPADSVFGWSYDTDYLRYAAQQRGSAASAPSLLTPYPPAVYFWYRQSLYYPSSISTEDLVVFRRDPLEPGMQLVVLDSDGKLLELHVRPPIDLPMTPQVPAFDWAKLFAAAGLDPAHFNPAEPHLTPAMAFDSQAAWTGGSNSQPPGMLRIEAAAYRGRPVFFRVFGPWTRPGQAQAAPMSLSGFVALVIVLPAIAGFLAWRNARSGRGDRHGAFRLAAFVLVGVVLEDIAFAHHVPATAEIFFLSSSFRTAVFYAGLFWVLYMAFEPQVRRRYPEALITWSRVLAGRLRDPRVGADVLIGVALGAGGLTLTESLLTPPGLSAAIGATRATLPYSTGMIVGFWLAEALGALSSLAYLFLLNLVSTLVRQRWLAASIFVLLATLVFTATAAGAWLAIVRFAVFFGIIAFALIRFGVLAVSAMVFTQLTLQTFPLTTNWSAWYAQSSWLAVCVLVGFALYGFCTTLAGRALKDRYQ